jgi:hypothetical protein
MKHTTSTEGVEHESSRACVVFDSQTGAILHVHRVVTWSGAKSPTEQEIETVALALAANDRRQRSRMRVLHVKPDSLLPRRNYKVDLEKLTLISEPRSA